MKPIKMKSQKKRVRFVSAKNRKTAMWKKLTSFYWYYSNRKKKKRKLPSISKGAIYGTDGKNNNKRQGSGAFPTAALSSIDAQFISGLLGKTNQKMYVQNLKREAEIRPRKRQKHGFLNKYNGASAGCNTVKLW